MKLLILLLGAALAGCASATFQTDQLLKSPSHEFPTASHVAHVPFIDQAEGQCGPATLTMAMNFVGKNISVEDIVDQVYLPEMKGSLQTDMISATRRQGLVPIEIDSLESLLKEVAAGNPVIVFENLFLSWVPQWHYALVFGYDLAQETVTLHSGPEQNKVWDLRKFERSWQLGDYWGLVVLPPEKLSATGNELAHARAGVALEQLGKTAEATQHYQAMLKRWPESLTALIAMGNLAYEQKDFKKSVYYLLTAAHEHPTVSSIWHNLALAENAAQMTAASKKSARRALDLAPDHIRPLYEISLNTLLQ